MLLSVPSCCGVVMHEAIVDSVLIEIRLLLYEMARWPSRCNILCCLTAT